MPKLNTKSIAGVTVNRSDFGRMRPVYERLEKRFSTTLHLVATGSHFDQKFGASINEVRESGLPISEIPVTSELPMLSASQITAQLGQLFMELKPDFCLLLGDRHEILASAQAAMYANVPIIHVGGGYITEGAIDDRIRHAVTKLAHYHLVANQQCADLIVQMGENPANVHVVGAPDIDMLRETPVIDRVAFMGELSLNPDKDFILVTIHPETHRIATMAEDIKAAFAVLADRPEQILITAPASEPGADFIFEEILSLTAKRTDVVFRRNLGQCRYVNAMRYAAAIFGNSSSGIIESSYYSVPVVNIGDRQKGRLMAENIMSASWDKNQLAYALDAVLSDEFSASLHALPSPYGDGYSAEI